MPVISWSQPSGLSLTAVVWNGGTGESSVPDEPYSVSPGALSSVPWRPGVSVNERDIVPWRPGVSVNEGDIVPWRPSVSRD